MSDEKKLNEESLYSLIDLNTPGMGFQGLEDLNTDDLPPDATVEATIMIFRAGKFEHPWFGDLEFTEQTLDEIIDNFNRGVVPKQIHFNIDHNKYTGTAVGWLDEGALFKEFVAVPGPLGTRTMPVLMARTQLNRTGAQLIKQKEYLYFSSEIHPDYTTREKVPVGNDEGLIHHGTTLVGGALTNNPFIPGLAQISFSEDFEEAKQMLDSHGVVVSENEGGVFYYAAIPGDGAGNAETSPEEEAKEEAKEEKEIRGKHTGVIFDELSFSQETDEQSGKSDTVISLVGDQDSGIQNHTTKLENKMEFSEILAKLGEVKNLDEQISYLESVSHNFSGQELNSLEVLILSKKQVREAEQAQAEAVRLASNAKNEVDRLKGQNRDLQLAVTQAKQGAWDHRVEAFTTTLHADGHFPSVINKVEQILKASPVASRDYEFALADADDETVDLMGVIGSVLASLPKEARVDESVELSADAGQNAGEVEIIPEGNENDEPAEIQPFADKPEGYHEGVQKYEQKFGTVDVSLYGDIDENGNLSF